VTAGDRVGLAAALAVTVCLPAASARADIAGIAPADDARQAIIVGERGEVYRPDGKGAWVRTERFAITEPVLAVERGTSGVLASGGGAVYRLADNGWSAVRLAQKGAAIGGSGRRALAAIGRQLFDLDRPAAASGEPVAVATLAAPASKIGGAAIATARGLVRLDGSKLVAVTAQATPISDAWGISDRGAVELRTGAVHAWPNGARVSVADAALDGSLVAVAANELITVSHGKVSHVAIPIQTTAVPIAAGVVADRNGRVVVAFRDGQIAVREHDTWTVVRVEDRVPAAKNGSPPATQP